MKCPKCGYHSFDDLQVCKKCQADLTDFKAKHGLKDIFSLSWGRKARKTKPTAKDDSPSHSEPDLFTLSEPSPAVLRMEPESPPVTPDESPFEPESSEDSDDAGFAVESEGLSSLDLESGEAKSEDGWGDDASFDEFFAETDDPLGQIAAEDALPFKEPEPETAEEDDLDFDLPAEEESLLPVEEDLSFQTEPVDSVSPLAEQSDKDWENLESDLFVELPSESTDTVEDVSFMEPAPEIDVEEESVSLPSAAPDEVAGEDFSPIAQVAEETVFAPAEEPFPELDDAVEGSWDSPDEDVASGSAADIDFDERPGIDAESVVELTVEDVPEPLEEEIPPFGDIEPEDATPLAADEEGSRPPAGDDVIDAFFPPPAQPSVIETTDDEIIEDIEELEEQEVLPFAATEEILEEDEAEFTLGAVEEEVEAEEEVEDIAEEFVPPQVALGARLAASLVDLCLLTVSFLLFLMVGAKALSPPGSSSWLPSLGDVLGMAIPYFLIFFTIGFCYFTLFHYMTGQTPGKMLLKFRIVDEDGDPLLFSQAFLRSVGGLVCLLPVGLGFFSILLNREQRGWDDQLAGTYVLLQEDEVKEGAE